MCVVCECVRACVGRWVVGRVVSGDGSRAVTRIHTQGTGHWASIAILCSTLDIAFVRMVSERVSRWAYLVRYAMLEYHGIRLVDRRDLLSLKDRVLMIESADYSSSDDWP